MLFLVSAILSSRQQSVRVVCQCSWQCSLPMLQLQRVCVAYLYSLVVETWLYIVETGCREAWFCSLVVQPGSIACILLQSCLAVEKPGCRDRLLSCLVLQPGSRETWLQGLVVETGCVTWQSSLKLTSGSDGLELSLITCLMSYLFQAQADQEMSQENGSPTLVVLRK